MLKKIKVIGIIVTLTSSHALTQTLKDRFVLDESAKCSALYLILTSINVPAENFSKIVELSQSDKEELLRTSEDLKKESNQYARQSSLMHSVYGNILSQYESAKNGTVKAAVDIHLSAYEKLVRGGDSNSWMPDVVMDQMICQKYLTNLTEKVKQGRRDLVEIARDSIYKIKDGELDTRRANGYIYSTAVSFQHWKALDFITPTKVSDQIRKSLPNQSMNPVK